jgi:predicted MFS family arabinose efflux permease
MSQISQAFDIAAPVPAHDGGGRVFVRSFVIGLTAFLTVVDLFATQAILPSLARHYDVSAGQIGLAVNASTIGMAVAGLGIAYFSRHIDRRRGILIALIALAVPTTLLASAPNLAVFALLRIAQGLCMASAFTLTLAYLGEQTRPEDTASAFAAYITGNVASNLIGRLISAAVADHLGLATNFYVFAFLNLAGAALVYVAIRRAPPMSATASSIESRPASWAIHLRNPRLCACFGIAFCILFAFIGTFTYVNFVLVREPLAVGMMALGFAYFVFLPSIVTTPLAGRAIAVCGTRWTLWGSLALAALGLPLMLVPSLPAVLTGMVLVGIGTFLAQATATGYVGRAATSDRGAASGIYLACYFLGGLVGSALLGSVFDRFGWPATVTGIAIAIGVAMVLAACLHGHDQPSLPTPHRSRGL